MSSPVLPDSESLTVLLASPTAEERFTARMLSSQAWRGPLSVEAFIEREQYLSDQEATRHGGLRPWILCDTAEGPADGQQRTVLASSETVRRNALVSYCENGDRKVEDTVCYGVASVFCRPEFRRRGYARRMVKELGRMLRGKIPELGLENCMFSVLYSDVGLVCWSVTSMKKC